MGMAYHATCKKCRHRFEVRIGGGFFFHLLHCTYCGTDKHISFKELGEVHLQYLKGLDVPYCVASANNDEAVRDSYSGRAISEATYERKVQKIAGTCQCGGSFTFRAKPRCPKCRSTRLEDNREHAVLYD